MEQCGPQDAVFNVPRSGVLAEVPYTIDALGGDGLEMVVI